VVPSPRFGALGRTRIGHTGSSIRPATGVLLLGSAGRRGWPVPETASDKSYEAVFRLGFATDTRTAEGRPSDPWPGALPSDDRIAAALDAFRGTSAAAPGLFRQEIDGNGAMSSRARARRADVAFARGEPTTHPPDLPALASSRFIASTS